jgi:hypothetical protein
MPVHSQALAMIRNRAEGFMTDTCAIKRPSSAVDDYGDVSETDEVVATGVTCRLNPKKLSDSAGVIAMQERGAIWYSLSVPYDQDLQDGDLVTISSVDYRVLTVERSHTDRAFRQATVVRHT